MKENQYSNIAPIGPARFVPQLLGGLAGGVGGFLKARNEARAAGEKVSFKSAWDDVLLGAGKGALNPVQGAIGLGMSGLETVGTDQALKAQQTANQDALALERDKVAQTARIGFDPLAAATKKGNTQNSSINNNPVFSPSSASLMMGIYKK